MFLIVEEEICYIFSAEKDSIHAARLHGTSMFKVSTVLFLLHV